MKYGLPLKIVPKWIVLMMLFILILLGASLFKIITSIFPAYNQLAFLSYVSGEVQVSDGITDIAANNGWLIARNERTLLKTGQGTASLTLWDGANIVIDSFSTIEFNHLFENNPENAFVFNLVMGRILIFNKKGSLSATQVLIGANNAVSVFESAAGLEVSSAQADLEKVDCLVGECLVNGVNLLKGGQNAQIGPGVRFEIANTIPYDQWALLGQAGQVSFDITNLLASLPPEITQSHFPPEMPVEAPLFIQNTGFLTLTASPESSPTISPTTGPSYTATLQTPTQPYPGVQSTLFYTATLRAQWSPAAPPPFVTSRTVTPPIVYPSPGFTTIPLPTTTYEPTPTLTLPSTPTPIPTLMPSQTPTPIPTLLPSQTSTPIPTLMPSLMPSQTSTSLPTSTFFPTPEPSFTPAPPPTSTPTRHIAPTPTRKTRPKNTPTSPPPPISTQPPVH